MNRVFWRLRPRRRWGWHAVLMLVADGRLWGVCTSGCKLATFEPTQSSTRCGGNLAAANGNRPSECVEANMYPLLKVPGHVVISQAELRRVRGGQHLTASRFCSIPRETVSCHIIGLIWLPLRRLEKWGGFPRTTPLSLRFSDIFLAASGGPHGNNGGVNGHNTSPGDSGQRSAQTESPCPAVRHSSYLLLLMQFCTSNPPREDTEIMVSGRRHRGDTCIYRA
jgi:hypothetical protein